MSPSSISSTDAGVEAWLACFGKHPGWNDHIDDIGLETEFLTTAKRTLYTEGMSGNIDGGVWEAYAEDERLDAFDHTVFSRTTAGLGVARMWSSRDGKGRAKYPMIVMAQTRHAPMAWLGTGVLGVLGRVEQACKAAETSSAVIETLDEARRELRQIAHGVTPAADTPKAPPTAIERLGETPELGPDRQGLMRVLYQIDRDCGPYLRQSRGDSGSKSRVFDIRPQAFRVPRPVPDPGECADLWMRLMYTVLDPATPLTVIIPEREDWADIIVGVPNAAVLSCVKATPKKSPLTTEIPYTIDTAFRARVDALIRAHREGDPEARTLGGDTDLGYLHSPGGPSVARALQTIRDQAAGTRSLPLPVLIGVGAGVLLILVLLLVFAFGGGGDAEGGGDRQAAEEIRTPVDPPGERTGDRGGDRGGTAADAGVPAEMVALWTGWCTAADAWLLGLLNAVELEPMRRDRHLSATVVPAIERMKSGEVEPSPARFAGVRARRMADLIASPPDALGTGAGREAARVAAGEIAAITEGLGTWPAVRNAGTLLGNLEDSSQLSGFLRERLGAVDPDRVGNGRELAEGIGQLLSLSSSLDTLGSVHDESARLAAALEATGEPLLVAVAPLVAESPGVLAGASTAEALARAAEDAASNLNTARLALNRYEQVYARVEPEKFEAESPSHRALAGGERSIALLGLWAEQVRQPQYEALAREMDPRGAVLSRLGDAEDSLDDLKRRHGAEATPLLAERAVAESFADFRGRAESVGALEWKHAQREQIEDTAALLRADLASMERTLRSIDTELSTSAEELLTRIAEHTEVAPGAPPSLNAFWERAREEAASAYQRSGNLTELRDWYESTPPKLERIADLVALPAGFGRFDRVRDAAAVMGAMTGAARAESDRLVGAYLAEQDLVSLDAGSSTLGDRWRGWTSELTADVGDVLDAEDALRALVGLDEAVGTRTLRERFERLAGTGRLEDPAMSVVFGPTMSAYREILELSALGLDPLVDAASDPESHPGVSWAAWNRAAEAGVADLDRARVAIDQQRRLISALHDTGRRGALGAVLDAQSVGVWERAASGARDWDAFASVARRAGEFGVTEDAMDAANTVRVGYLTLLRRLGPGPALDDSERSEILARARALRDRAGALGWSGLSSSLGEAIAPLAGEDTGPAFDPSVEGPGRHGWDARASDDASTIWYSWPAGGGGAGPDAPAVTLEFRAVPGAEGGAGLPTFVMTREVSVADVLAICESAGLWEQVRATLIGGLDDPRSPDSRAGPRSWDWVARGEPGQRLAPAGSWLSAEYGGQEPYASGYDPGAPSMDSPMQYVSAPTALWLAERIGCRLPTIPEWLAGHDRYGETGEVNRRDASWDRQRLHAIDQEAQRRIPRYPDEGIYRASRSGVAVGRDAEPAVAGDDGVLWFQPVTAGSSWVGNVAEMVTEAPVVSVDGVLRDHDVWSEMMRSGAVGISIIGASGLSGAEADPVQPGSLSARRVDAAYADVGFRLALSVGQAPRPHWSVAALGSLEGAAYVR